MAEHFIPVRKSEIVAALIADAPADGDAENGLGQLFRLLGSIFHYEYFDELEKLKDAYFHFNPHHAGRLNGSKPDPAIYPTLIGELERVLAKANFVPVTADELQRSFHEHSLVQAEVEAPVEDYRDIRFFRRGQHRERIETQRWFGYRRTSVEIEVYDDVVLVAALKPAEALAAAERKRLGRLQGDTVFIKYFRDIASADLNALLPNVRVIMSIRDKLRLGLPALFGGIPLILKLAPTLAVLLFLIGIHLGYSGGAGQDRLEQAIAVMSGVIALGSFMIHQWLKYQRQALRYQIEINDAIYFRNLNNNAGIFDTIIGAAEEQECKEAFLAYFFLLGRPMVRQALDETVEAWLAKRFAVTVDFEVDDGLAKLERLGLLSQEGDTLSVPPLGEALRRLDAHWDDFFRFNLVAPAPAPDLRPTA